MKKFKSGDLVQAKWYNKGKLCFGPKHEIKSYENGKLNLIPLEYHLDISKENRPTYIISDDHFILFESECNTGDQL